MLGEQTFTQLRMGFRSLPILIIIAEVLWIAVLQEQKKSNSRLTFKKVKLSVSTNKADGARLVHSTIMEAAGRSNQ